MRAYFFGNMYLSSIQQGIQAAHVTSEMFAVYEKLQGEAHDTLHEWANDHKTMILLNGGFLETMEDLWRFIDFTGNPYPFAKFHEGLDSLGGVLTSVGIVLPEKIYIMAAAMRRFRRPIGESQYTIQELIQRNGSYTVQPDNTLGFDIEEVTIMVYDKWEYDLMNRLNEFGMAS